MTVLIMQRIKTLSSEMPDTKYSARNSIFFNFLSTQLRQILPCFGGKQRETFRKVSDTLSFIIRGGSSLIRAFPHPRAKAGRLHEIFSTTHYCSPCCPRSLRHLRYEILIYFGGRQTSAYVDSVRVHV